MSPERPDPGPRHAGHMTASCQWPDHMRTTAFDTAETIDCIAAFDESFICIGETGIYSETIILF